MVDLRFSRKSKHTTMHKRDNTLDQIGRYTIASTLGSGSMGTVFEAFDPFQNERVAVKVAHPEYSSSNSDDKFRRLFFNEARAAGLLEHANILRVRDADIDNQLCFLVMDLVSGARTLEMFCAPDNLLSMREVVGIIFKLARALDYAHRQGVIHRDIKPSNILLTKQRDVKLSDFSIAMINRSDHDYTQFRGLLGSPLYMSPEQINVGTITHRSDIFTLGGMMYQLLTGRHPFAGRNMGDITKKINQHNPLPPKSLMKDCPPGLNYTVKRMLQKDPKKRYQSALDVSADLSVIFEDLDLISDEDNLRSQFDAIKGLNFFKEFQHTDIWELMRSCVWRKYDAGKVIIREGDFDLSFYIIVSGSVSVIKAASLVNVLRAGDCFGEMGYLSEERRSATVVAADEVTLMRVTAEQIDNAKIPTQLRFLRSFVNTLMGRLTEATTHLALRGGG